MRSPAGLTPFLSAYDPSDLPGGSIDPLGFERGYLFLADKILPGLTNAAGRPRYLSLVCAGAYLAPNRGDNERDSVRLRAKTVLLLERFWAAANVLASENGGNLNASGIRGVTYAQRYVGSLTERNISSADGDFKMLAHQERYGAIGIYANVAGYLRLLNRATMSATGDLGEHLAQGFLDETNTPAKLRAIVRDGGGNIGIDALKEWGQLAHVSARVGSHEGEYLGEAFLRDATRRRLADLLKAMPYAGKNETELSRLRRIGARIPKESTDQDLREAIKAILAFEDCYRLLLLAFERILWLCKTDGEIGTNRIGADAVVGECREKILKASRQLHEALNRSTTSKFSEDLQRLNDVKAFVGAASDESNQTRAFADVVLERHAEVQRGKFDGGRRKLPWVERKADRYQLTLARVGESRGEPQKVDNIRPHEYRLAVADRFIAAREGRAA